MSYDYFKIFHIISAALLLTSMTYCFSLWRGMNSERVASTTQRIQQQTWLIILPAAMVQLATGFTMISLNHYEMSELWLSGSVIGFMVVIGGWFGFVYFLMLAQQLVSNHSHRHQLIVRLQFFRRIQSIMLAICGLAIVSMVFLMANKVT